MHQVVQPDTVRLCRTWNTNIVTAAPLSEPTLEQIQAPASPQALTRLMLWPVDGSVEIAKSADSDRSLQNLKGFALGDLVYILRQCPSSPQ